MAMCFNSFSHHITIKSNYSVFQAQCQVMPQLTLHYTNVWWKEYMVGAPRGNVSETMKDFSHINVARKI